MIEGLKPYPGYKESGLPWVGKIPTHWDTRRLSSVAQFDSGKAHEKFFEDEGEHICVTARFVSTDGVARKFCTRNFSPAEKGDVLMVMSDLPNGRALARAFLVTDDASYAVNQRVCIIRPRKMLPGFLAYQANRNWWLLQNDDHCNQTHLSNRDYKTLPLVNPPMEEQAAIVRFLDHANRKIDGFIRAKRKLIGLLNEQKQAIIHRAVTRGLPAEASAKAGLDPDVRLKDSGIPWLGEIPEHWEVKKLRFLFRYAKGSSAAQLTNEYIGHNPGEFPVFSGQTEHGGLMGKISWHEFDFPSPVIFVSTVGARAMTTRILSGKFSLSQNCALIIPRNSHANPIYFEKVFQRLFAYERHSISQIMQPSLRFADLNRFYVPHPPLNEQEAVASEIDRECSKIDTAIARTEREIALMQEYRTRLVADVVTGKLDVRAAAARLPEVSHDSNFAPAVEEVADATETEEVEE